jgi:L-asparaginase / beta-aspartyl-peptidase
VQWKLMVHAGAGSMRRGALSNAEDATGRLGLSDALDAARMVLAGSGTALDAVEVAVRVLEDDSHFNAGRGSVFTWDARIECDAAIMDGHDRTAGAVAGVSATRNPVSLARAVMDKTAHVFLASAGADAFSRWVGETQADSSWFATPERRQQLEIVKSSDGTTFDSEMKFGTVGAVAIDQSGTLAAATSTGGLTGKRWGRIGDSPVIGAGTYADNRAAAVSCTGSGEHFIRTGFAAELCARLRLTNTPAGDISDTMIGELGTFGGKGGFIGITRDGRMLCRFNTPGMYRGTATAKRDNVVAIFDDEDCQLD